MLTTAQRAAELHRFAAQQRKDTNMTQYAPAIYTADRDDISAIDLRKEMDKLDAEGTPYWTYTAEVYDEETTEHLPLRSLQIVEVDGGRFGICSNGTSDWADYPDLEQAVNDYLNDPDTFAARN